MRDTPPLLRADDALLDAAFRCHAAADALFTPRAFHYYRAAAIYAIRLLLLLPCYVIRDARYFRAMLTLMIYGQMRCFTLVI